MALKRPVVLVASGELGQIDVVDSIDILYGGTGANTAAGARLSLGLGSLSLQDAALVSITGGTIDNITIDGGAF